MTPDTRLWYQTPARIWPHAMPIGNGRLGAMVFGYASRERWQLNEDSVWYGGPRDRNPTDALRYLPKLRQLLDEGRLQEAENLAQTAFVGMPEMQRHYEPAGQVNLIFPHQEDRVVNYRRDLDLEQAVTTVSYELDGVQYFRELFSSYPANVIAAKLTASVSGKLSFQMRLIRHTGMPMTSWAEIPPGDIDTCLYMDTISVVDNCLVLRAITGGNGVGLALTATVRVDGGNVEFIGETIIVENANAAFIYLSCETTFRHPDPQAVCLSHLKLAATLGYDQLRTAHIMDYCQLFSRVTFHLGSVEDRHSVLSRPTDERVKQVRSGHPDLSLIALYYQFGRYLLISSSRPGYKALPANLQGIWNEQMGPAWGSKFTINVNTEMNYWLAETTNLSECHEPFLEFIKRLQKNGEITARKMYGCGGWVAHHNSDIWADTAPQDRVLDSTLWPMGAAWASTHIMEHFAFTGDIVFLDQAYGTLRGSVEFFLEFLIEKDGYLVTSPSLSPENRYQLPSGESAAISVGPTMDRQILFHLFTDFLNAANELHKENEDREIIATVTKFREKLPPLRIGRYGQLQEWREDYEEVEPGHRHVSHLWGLFPGEQITLKSTTLIDACRKTLERRAQFGGGHTGWSRAWMIALWARLRDGEEAARHVQEILRTSTHDSLLDDHPPFQIDGNFGATAGIAEMLVQSHDGEVFLLPALPTSWPEGCLQGLRTRGGFELSLIWSSGHLVTGTLHSLLGGTCVLNAHQSVDVRSPDGHLVAELKGTDNSPVSFETEKGAQYLLGRH